MSNKTVLAVDLGAESGRVMAAEFESPRPPVRASACRHAPSSPGCRGKVCRKGRGRCRRVRPVRRLTPVLTSLSSEPPCIRCGVPILPRAPRRGQSGVLRGPVRTVCGHAAMALQQCICSSRSDAPGAPLSCHPVHVDPSASSMPSSSTASPSSRWA